jgi:hypothetical protein
MNRLEQLTRNNSSYYQVFTNFEKIVKPDSSILTFLPIDSYEYPLFGKNLSRKVIPIHTYDGKNIMPPEADYLLYSDTIFPCVEKNDISLGEGWYIRDLGVNSPFCTIIEYEIASVKN